MMVVLVVDTRNRKINTAQTVDDGSHVWQREQRLEAGERTSMEEQAIRTYAEADGHRGKQAGRRLDGRRRSFLMLDGGIVTR